MPGNDRLPRASLVENAGFNALVVVPNVAQGLFRRRGPAVKAATLGDVDGKSTGLLAGMSRRYGGGPVWVRMGLDEALLLLDPADIGRVLEGSTDDYAGDPEAKRKGMGHFQPDALTISRGEEWRSRRRFTEAVLAGAEKLTDHVVDVTVDEVQRMLGDTGGAITFEPWNKAFQRITRRVVLGDAAAGDWALTDTLARMMGGANNLPGKPSDDVPAFTERIAAYLDRADSASLAGFFAGAPTDADTFPARQVTHWLFALGDTLAVNALRAVPLLAHHPAEAARGLADESGEFLTACLQEAMRLWPTTPMLSRETLRDIEWNESETVRAGSQVVVVNTYTHRDPDRLPYADRFAPDEWITGSAASYAGFNQFSRGPQGCPGSALALLVGRTALRTVLERTVTNASPSFPEGKPLPHMVNFFDVKVSVE